LYQNALMLRLRRGFGRRRVLDEAGEGRGAGPRFADDGPEVFRQLRPLPHAGGAVGVQLQEGRLLARRGRRERAALFRRDDARLLDRQQLQQWFLGVALLLALQVLQRQRPLARDEHQGAAAVRDILLQPPPLREGQLLRRGVAEDDAVEVEQRVGGLL